MKIVKINLSPSKELEAGIEIMIDTAMKVLYEGGRPKKKHIAITLEKVAVMCVTEGMGEGVEAGVIAGIKATHTKHFTLEEKE